ncbi:MAG: HxsD-like protein [bacterium]
MPERRIEFASSLYSEEGVREAARAFAEVVEITVSVEGAAIVAQLGDYDGDRDVLGDELGNHALYETIVRETEAGDC